MFCPKCGTKNPEDGKFCRSCGADVSAVGLALTGGLTAKPTAGAFDCEVESNDPNEIYANAIRSILTGIGFAIVSVALLFTGVAGGRAWWWAMLFPSFFALAKGIADYFKFRRMTQVGTMTNPVAFSSNGSLGHAARKADLPPSTTQYVQPDSQFKTGDLVPPSVVENTTRQLEINSEGETISLPKQ